MNPVNVYIPSEPSNVSTYDLDIYIPDLWINANLANLVDKKYVDSQITDKMLIRDRNKPIVTVWAMSQGDLSHERRDFIFNSGERWWTCPVNGKMIKCVIKPATLDLDSIQINIRRKGSISYYSVDIRDLYSGHFFNGLGANDSVSFQTIPPIDNIDKVIIILLIELDLDS